MKYTILLICILALACHKKNYTSDIEKYMKEQVDKNNFSGVVLVMKDDKVVVEKAYGLADREWNIPNTVDTKFRIGSLTKQFTATCILQLQEQGKLAVTDKLSKYIPDYPKGDSITIQMLLNHTSGIKNYTDVPEFWNGIALMRTTPDSMISIFKNKPLDFSPGTDWKYSNSGYFLLGYIIEKVTGGKYTAYVEKNVIKKVGMVNSGIDKLDSVLYHRASGYDNDSGKFFNSMFISMEGPFSAGAMYSTVDDLYKWDRALYSTAILSNASKTQMFTPVKHNYGFGVGIDTFQHHYRISHSGGISGFVSELQRYPIDNICVIVLSNDGGNSPAIANGISSILFDAPLPQPNK